MDTFDFEVLLSRIVAEIVENIFCLWRWKLESGKFFSSKSFKRVVEDGADQVGGGGGGWMTLHVLR